MALTSRIPATLAVIAVTLALAAACSRAGDVAAPEAGDTTSSTSSTSTSTSTATTNTDSARDEPAGPPAGGRPVDLGGAARYVALGDSFSAGDGLAPYEDPGCNRSPRAYPNLVGFAGEVRLDARACAAARLPTVAAQADAAGLGGDVGLVTLTVGGNDVGFIEFFTACAAQTACFDAPYGGEPTLRDWSSIRLAALGPALEDLLTDLREAAPNARVALLGYPQLLPGALGSSPGCQLLGAFLDDSELAALRASTDTLNAVLADAAAATGAVFVDVGGRFAGHEACGSGESWLQFGNLATMVSSPEGLLHPNDAGQAAYAAALSEALGG